MTFKELGLGDMLLEALDYMGFEQATPVQAQAIPEIIKGMDVLACAQTGTGKTAAFILPVLNDLINNPPESGHISTLVLAPTRELAMQIEQQIEAFTYFSSIGSIAIYGGGDGKEFIEQKKALRSGIDIVVATPGKLISHLNMGYVNFKHLKHFILDEADRMLDMGFLDDIKLISSHLSKDRQTLLFSATMPPKIKQLSQTILKDYAEINLGIAKPAKGVLQAAYLAYETQKADLIGHLINDKPSYESIIVFSSTKKKVIDIVRRLTGNGYEVRAVSSDLEQSERELVIRKFRAKKVRVIVATDVLSRGIDIKDINLVINYDAPNDAEDYVHRIGRTARANTTGVALTLINEDDMDKFAKIEKLIEMEVMKLPLPKHLGSGPTWQTRSRSKSRSKSNKRNSRGNYRRKK